MDKYEYNVKSDKIKKLYSQKNFEEAAAIADEIDWYKVKDNTMINRVADIYENTKQYEKAKEILLIAYERSPLGRQLAYKLTILAIRTKNFVEADEFYQDFVEMSPSDVSQYLLKYRIAKAKGEDIDVLIKILEAYIDVEMDERWEYELAKLYHEAGRDDKCIEMCNELELWFNDGKYVNKAKELKKLITGVMEEYHKRYDSEAGVKTDKEDSQSEESISVEKQDEQILSVQPDQEEIETKQTMEPVMEKEQEPEKESEEEFDDTIDDVNQENEEPETDSQKDLVIEEVEEERKNEKGMLYTLFGNRKNTDAYRKKRGSRYSTKEETEEEEEEDDEDSLEDVEEMNPNESVTEAQEQTVKETTANTLSEKELNESDYSKEESLAVVEDEDYADEDYEEDEEEEYEEEDNDEEEYSPMKSLAESLVNDDRELEIIRAEEALRAAEAAAVEAQRAADIAKRFVEEARLRANMVKGIASDKIVLGKGTKYEGMTIDEVRAQLDEEERIYERNREREDKKHKRRSKDSASDSKIEIFEFDKSKEGKGKRIGDELTKTAEIDIDEIKINIADGNDPYNTANIQQALAKSMAKLMSETEDARESDGFTEEEEEAVETTEEKTAAETTEEKTAAETMEEETAAETTEEETAAETTEEEAVAETAEEETAAETTEEETAAETTEEETAAETMEEETAAETTEEKTAAETTEEETAAETMEEDTAAETTEEETAAETTDQEAEQEIVETADNLQGEADQEEDYLENDDFAPTKRINRDEINRLLKANKTMYQTVPLSPLLNQEEDGQISLSEERKEETQIEGQMTFEDVLFGREQQNIRENQSKEAASIIDAIGEIADTSQFEAIQEEVLPQPEQAETEKEVPQEEKAQPEKAVPQVETPEAVIPQPEEEISQPEATILQPEEVIPQPEHQEVEEVTPQPEMTKIDEVAATESAGKNDKSSEVIAGALSDLDLAEEVMAVMAEKEEPEVGATVQDNVSEEEQLQETQPQQSEINASETKEPETKNEEEPSQQPDVVVNENAYKMTKHQIPENYREMFDDFLSTESMEESIAITLDNLINHFDMDGTSRTNNVIITGNHKSGKTTLGLSIIKAANRGRNRSGRKVAKVKASVLNKRGVTLAMTQIIGTDLIIEQAGNMMPNTIVDLIIAMKNFTEEMLIVMEDDKAAIDRMLISTPELKKMFTNRLDIQEMEINDMVRIAKDYAASQMYDIDEIGELALYAKLDDISGRNLVMSIEDIQEVVDDAIQHARRFSFGRLIGKMKKGKGENGVLSEQDFLD